MRVNISYSVELDEIPLEVERILAECNAKIREIHGQLSQTMGGTPLDTLEGLDKVRLNMSKADLQLDDCMQILTGYIQTLARLPELKQELISSGPEPQKENKDE